jgi:hypothetical protein
MIALACATDMTQLLDSVPDVVILPLIVLAMVAAYELGFRFGAWRERRNPEEKEGPTGALVGSLLALMAFLLAITMGMASDRYDTRRGLVQEEANAIRSTFLRAGYLPQPVSGQIQEIVRQYVPLRIGTPGITSDQIQAQAIESKDLIDQAWTITDAFISENFQSDAYSAFVDALDDMTETGATRVTAINNRVPDAILFFLLVGSILAIGLVGYDAGLTLRRSLVAAVLLVILFGAVLYLVLDLNQPTSGIFTISQQPLITVQQEIGPPTGS